MLKTIMSNLYRNFLIRRNKFLQPFLFCVLVLSLIVGAGYRSIIIKERFSYDDGLGAYVSMASNFTRAPGKYSNDEYAFIKNKPDEYIYTVGKSKFEPMSPMSSEIGWSVILSLILKEGTKGLNNIALFIVRYQLMVELLIIIFLFWIGKRIAGVAGALLVPLLYAIFKMPMVMMSEAKYYYWTIPFSILSLVFWTVIYRPEDNNIKVYWKYLSFFLYGILIGFATSLRVYFLFLPLFMAPFMFIREKAIKKGIILLMIMLLGQSVFLVPQIFYNKKHFGKFAITTRGHWHLFVQAVGLYPNNPWGIKDSGEINLNEWAKARGAPDMFENIENSEKWYKRQYYKMFKEHPEIFIGNFLKHFKNGFTTIHPHDFYFFGFSSDKNSDMDLIGNIFPWMVLSSLFLLFVLSRNQFWMIIAALLQGLYLLLVVVTWFANYTPFMAGYIPVYILLLAVSIAVHMKLLVALMEGGVRCWLNGSGLRDYRAMVVESYREDWSAGYKSVNLTEEQNSSINVSAPIKEAKGKFSSKFKTGKIYLGIFAGIFLIIIGASFLMLSKKDPFDKKQLLSKAYAAWTLDDTVEGIIKDSKGKHDAISVNTEIMKGPWGNARHFNGRNSVIKTPVSFSGWKAFTISLWARPEKKDGGGLSVILDNGHDANTNFVIQTADINNSDSERWVLHFNGKDILLSIPFEQWTHLVIVVDAEKGYVKAYTGGKEAGIVEMGRFELGDTPLTFGKLAKNDDRYFKGTIEEIVVLNKIINE